MERAKFRLDLADERLWRGDQPVQLANKAFELLRLLVANPERLLTKDHILDVVWGGTCVSEGLVKEYVHDLRQALGDDPKCPRYIETVHGRGYRFLGGIDQAGPSVRAGAPTRSNTEVPSLAVLAFDNLSGDPAQEYFSDGITEDIITGLSKNPYLDIVSRNSVFHYKGKSFCISDLRGELGARYVLEGSVRKIGRHVRVTAQLIDAERDLHLWAESYDRDLDDIFAVQDEIVGSIVHALGAKDGALEKSARQLSGTKPSALWGAYDCYLQARDHFYRYGDSGFEEAEGLYQKAINLDPGFARAYSGLASLHFLRFKKYLTASFEDIENKVLDLALRAVQLDPNDYLAHWVLGRLYGCQGKRTQGLAEFDRALRINPNDANLLVVHSESLVYCGRPEQALEQCQRAIRLNPNCPDWYWWNLGFAYFHLGRYREALDSIERMTTPDQARRLLAAVLALLGRIDEARAEAAGFMKANPDFSIAAWARTELYVDPEELRRYESGLRLAGFPE